MLSADFYSHPLDRSIDVNQQVQETYPGELTAISRQGSGSACRSLYGGFVRWEMGQQADGKDSIAVQVADEAHWPELEVLICVVSDIKKDTSSTAGMADSVRTSELLAHRAAAIVPGRLSNIEEAYKAKDFATFAEIAMKDSNQFHATCMDTYPPIFYTNDVSRSIMRTVHALNAEAGEVLFGYTFDAGESRFNKCWKYCIHSCIQLRVTQHVWNPRNRVQLSR
jgi:diphosphomevalonate decarboxylase